MCVCMYICIHIYTYVYIYIYISTFDPKSIRKSMQHLSRKNFPASIQNRSNIYPKRSTSYPKSIHILSSIYPDSIQHQSRSYPEAIQNASKSYPTSIQYRSKLCPKSIQTNPEPIHSLSTILPTAIKIIKINIYIYTHRYICTNIDFISLINALG